MSGIDAAAATSVVCAQGRRRQQHSTTLGRRMFSAWHERAHLLSAAVSHHLISAVLYPLSDAARLARPYRILHPVTRAE